MLKNSVKSLILIALLLSGAEYTQAQKSGKVSKKEKHPRNVIIMIGDGMGLAQMYAAYTATDGKLRLAEFEHIALSKTYSANDYTTDSGAGGTAIACGVKTNNGMIGMNPDSVAVKSILRLAEEHGLSTGLVVSCDVTHATPASFVASVPNRKQSEDIAKQYLDTDIDVFIGGGYDAFAKRSDSLNLIDQLVKRNYQVATAIPAMLEVNSGKLAALLYPAHPPRVSEGRGDMLSLSVAKAIDLLKTNKDGFVLMVEGSQIDWGGHGNDTDYVVEEVIDFDKAIGVALDFARHDQQTLVIITADHETGGMANAGGNFKTGEAKGAFTTGNHSAIPVPTYAFGPGAENFKGIIENTDIFRLMSKLLGFSK